MVVKYCLQGQEYFQSLLLRQNGQKTKQNKKKLIKIFQAPNVANMKRFLDSTLIPGRTMKTINNTTLKV